MERQRQQRAQQWSARLTNNALAPFNARVQLISAAALSLAVSILFLTTTSIGMESYLTQWLTCKLEARATSLRFILGC